VRPDPSQLVVHPLVGGVVLVRPVHRDQQDPVVPPFEGQALVVGQAHALPLLAAVFWSARPHIPSASAPLTCSYTVGNGNSAARLPGGAAFRGSGPARIGDGPVCPARLVPPQEAYLASQVTGATPIAMRSKLREQTALRHLPRPVP